MRIDLSNDTIRYSALKSWQDGQNNLAHSTKTKKKEKLKIKTE